ncbi:MAG: hypothetical protein WCO04_00110 [Pseudomonadota bacterium]
MTKKKYLSHLMTVTLLSACAFAAPSRVNQSFYTELGTNSFSPKNLSEMEQCVYFAFFDNRLGEFQVRREETRTGKRVNMTAGSYDLVSADINTDGSFQIFKYYSALTVPWVKRVVSASDDCARQNT